MLWNASALIGYPIKGTDGPLGTLAGLMYDETDWTIRWLFVDTGTWLSGRRVALPISAAGQPDPKAPHLPVNLTMKQVEDSPDVDVSHPFSQEAETLVSLHYGLPSVRDRVEWLRHVGRTPELIAPVTLRALPTEAPAESESRDNHVHGISEITGNSIEATDGDIGHAEDFLIDTTLWQVRYLVVDTSNWWSGQKLLVSPLSIDWIDWARSIIHLDVTRQKVKDSPPYVVTDTVDGAYEELFETYYGIRWLRR